MPPEPDGRIEDDAVVGLDDVDDGLHERGRREELAVVVRLLDGELGEKVFVDAAEDIAGGLLDLLAVEEAHQVFEHLGLEDAVVLGQHALQRLESGLDGGHGLGDKLGQVAAAGGGLLHDPVVAGVLRQPERTAPEIVGRLHLALGHLAGRLIFLDLVVGRLKAIGGVTEKDHAQDRHEVVAGGELRVGAEVVRGFPEVGFELFDVIEGFVGHAAPPRSWHSQSDVCRPRMRASLILMNLRISNFITSVSITPGS